MCSNRQRVIDDAETVSDGKSCEVDGTSVCSKWEPAREGPNLACEISKKSQWSLNLLAMLANIPINFILEISETAVSWESCDC